MNNELISDSSRANNITPLFDNTNSKEWLKTNEAAAYLGITPNALRIKVHRNQIFCFKFGRQLRFRIRDLRSIHKPNGE